MHEVLFGTTLILFVTLDVLLYRSTATVQVSCIFAATTVPRNTRPPVFTSAVASVVLFFQT